MASSTSEHQPKIPQPFVSSIQPPTSVPQAGPSSLITPAMEAVRAAVEDIQDDEEDAMPSIDMDSDSDG